jgi:hypothetical protein
MTTRDSVAIVENFWREVWQQPQNPDAIDKFVHEDFILTSGGTESRSRGVQGLGQELPIPGARLRVPQRGDVSTRK